MMENENSESKNWMDNPVKSRRIAVWTVAIAWFTVGVFIGGMVVFVVLNRGVHEISGNADKAITALKTESAGWEKSARECAAQFTTATLLVETTNPVRADVGGMSPFAAVLQALVPGAAPAPPAVQSVEGWYVPAKVEPIAYGKGQRFYWYFDKNEKKISGPFVPVRNGGLVQ